MDTRPVLFLDSGAGGIPYCRHFNRRNPGEAIVYLADRLRFPYGGRGRNELVVMLSGLMEQLVAAVNPKIAVLACNTATVSALDELRRRFPAIPFVGTVPAVKPAALASKTGRVGVLGTERTIDDPYIRRLAAEHGGCAITGIAAPELVAFVERRFAAAGEAEKRREAGTYIERFRAAGVDSVVLGCTHFLFLLEEFRAAAAPDITVFESTDGISRRTEFLLDSGGGALRSGGGASAENILLLTGKEPPESSWQNLAAETGFGLSLLGEP
jgi:glutamate racemase